MMCELNSRKRGVSMSRFIRTLKPFLGDAIKRVVLEQILKAFINILSTNTASLKFDFKMPIEKNSPLSDNSFPQYYQCSFRCDYKYGEYHFYESVRVQYSAYCPCSAALCKFQKNGFPHNQRAFADVLVKTNSRDRAWLEDIIDLVEDAVRTVPYPIVKRNDEAYIAGIAAVYPQFVEDAVRRIGAYLRGKRWKDWIVKCTHEESIHTSNAIAIDWKGVEGGFNENTYI
jgi:GTP cyclohydrolase I